MPVDAVTVHWPRQYVKHSNDAVLPLQPYPGVEHLLPALYTLDTLPGLPLHRSHRHDQDLPPRYCEDAIIASTPQTIFGRAITRASSA
jgi:hypothetical protein